MAKTLLVLGESSTGKSTSLRNLDPKSTFVITPNTKDLPFPGSREKYTPFAKETPNGNLAYREDLVDIKPVIKHVANKMPHIKVLVLEDFSHYLTHRSVSPSFSQDNGYGKWGTLGADVYHALLADLEGLRSDLTIIILHHTEIKENGEIQEATAGKMMDTKIKLHSWYDIILHAFVLDADGTRRYRMLTQKVGAKLAKSPPGMFGEDHVANDMAKIIGEIENYYAGKSKHVVEFID